MSNPSDDPAQNAPSSDAETGGRSAVTAAPAQSPTGSGREAQPADEVTVEQQADTADRLEAQNRPIGDAAGINPDRRQTTHADVTEDDSPGT
jgi:hypothetical protein